MAEERKDAGARNGAATVGPTGPASVKGGAASGAAASAVAEVPDLPAGLPDGPKWLDENRAAAWMAFHTQPMPDRAAHLWRYSDPAAFQLPAGAGGPESIPVTIEQAGSAGAIVLPLAAAVREFPEIVREHLGRLIPAGSGKPEDLNGALWSAGTFIRVPKGVALAEPIRLLATVSGGGAFRAIRNLIVIEAGASATIVEESRGEVLGRDSLNEVTELFAGPDSQVRYMLVTRLGGEVTAHRTLRARLESQAKMLTVIAYAGCGLYKADLGVSLDGEGSESRMVGLCLGDGKNRSDHHTIQNHTARHTTSDIDFRVVLGGRARSAYTGLIRIAQDAPYCEAFQENRNLLLSENCRAESIPELEILTDEVRCKHGATAGPIDQEQLFYLASRGLPPSEATRMVVAGFLEAALGLLPAAVADSLRAELTERITGL
jgi:Fe-S cluster assembly protein SufD